MKKLSILLLTVLLSSCASMRYGNFTNASTAKDAYLAKDAVSQLTRVYPPAQNTFCFRQKICDGFGRHLIQAMRQKGYGVIENVHPRQKANFSMWLMKPNLVGCIASVYTLARKY